MKFLQQIAKIYAEKLTPTAQLLFVFPNRRAGLFFRKELLALVKKTIFAPDITDINSLAATLSPLHKANDVELLFDLYQSYIHVRSQHTDNIETIDAFVPFGTTLLGDFNEIDKYLIDTNLLFSNIADLKNINDQSQFLSQQQIEVLNTFWGNVTKKTNENDENLSFNKQFITLWDDLHEIYTHFTETLIAKGIGYDGLIYRTAIDNLSTLNSKLSTLNSICFIGFNSLTTSEYRIFKHFQQLGIADFYFDYPTCYDTPSPLASTVAKYYNRNIKEFPSRYPYTQPTDFYIPNISLHSTPSATNQINVACSLLSSNSQLSTLNSTAILLTDESLMPSLIQQLPNNIEKINITMGYPLSITPIATLINHILTLQIELTNNKEGVKQFYYKPLLSILSHSSIQNISPTFVAQIINHVTKANYIRITAAELQNIINNLNAKDEEKQFFISLFTPQTTSNELLEYLNDITSQLSKFNTQLSTDSEFLYQYGQLLNQLKKTINKSQLSTLTTQLLKTLIQRLSSSLKVQFKGEPVEGMQIMGLLESRLLDFENIILVGFNDQRIPGNKSVNSIIPYNLRRAYNLPTQEISDAIQAYNFYRTLYHTKNLHLIYDSRSEGAQNEISRYYYQLKYLINAPMTCYNYTLPISNKSELSTEPTTITIDKTNEILAKLDSYKNDNFLSASRIKNYISCPLKFYFSSIIGIKTPNEINETGESGLLGRIYHSAMEEYYNNYSAPKILKKEEIEELVEFAFKKESEESHKQINISGFNSLIFNIVCNLISDTIKFDIKRHKKQPFYNVRSEEEIRIKINDVNFVAYIDRIDSTEQTTNIIDYKTTTSKTNKEINIINLVTSHESAYHELFQILLYCYFYKLRFGNTKLLPSLYKISSLKSQKDELDKITLHVPNELLTEPLPPFDIDLNEINTDNKNCTKIEITDYTEISRPFEWITQKILYDIYNPQKPFAQTPNATIEKACKFCPYTTICKK